MLGTSDVIASRGRTFGPYEVEATLRGHKAVSRAAVVGIRQASDIAFRLEVGDDPADAGA